MVLIPPVWTDKNNEYTRTLGKIRSDTDVNKKFRQQEKMIVFLLVN